MPANPNLNDKHVFMYDCKGPNAECRRAHKRGLTVHMTPMNFEGQSVILPRHHFISETDALSYYERVASEGVIVHNASERDAAYARKDIVIFASDFKL
jgi:hypothetical protein